jgi:hypothetical protein
MPAPDWADLVWAADNDTAVLSRASRRGTLTRLAPGLYTGAVDDDPTAVVARNQWAILGHELPGAVVVDKSARAAGAVEGIISVAHPRSRPLILPGLRIVPRSSAGPLERDVPLLEHNIFIASPARIILDSLTRPGALRLTRTEIEQWIDEMCAHGGAVARLNSLRDHARTIAPFLHAGRALGDLERIISAALTTGNVADVGTPALVARATGHSVDEKRLTGFEILAHHLYDTAPRVLATLPEDEPRRALLPFYESYFSNYIEGTEFTLDEAAGIVFDGTIPDDRPADAHDVMGTFGIVADPVRNREAPRDPDEFCTLLRRWHSDVMNGRPDKLPGEFKERANRAGTTEFVAPEQVLETLRRGFEIGTLLNDAFQRAVYIMFLVAEVHPFADGNGRTARIAMNAELSAAAQARVLIPIVYRLDYVGALRAASRDNAFKPLVAVLEFAQRYTARVDFTDRTTAENDLTRTNALRDPYEAEQAGIRLILP